MGISDKELANIHAAIIKDTNIVQIVNLIVKIIQVEGCLLLFRSG